MKKERLQLEQLDQKIGKVGEIIRPTRGWVYAIRSALGMSLRQLGTRMKMTAQSVREMELREKNRTISLKVLDQFASSMDMKLVYGFIPKQKSLQQMLDERALEIAKEIVFRTSQNMALEGQKNSAKRLEKAIKTRAKDIRENPPKYLWD
ncbi:XRE family transcriptional regulator [Leptospira sarikeiensis]|uniref:XRE family transcriptional regulator n=1 Tax=Leptospira sarikeiensis TaxID=2484943 RepID=A0A4R9KDM0_9LEPT|nr:XRE family transcriptional regulator [Leptospira sarikeiensis]TGL63272.1 XRE family transcriptional regulator [Leptospira sarikeiensis]